jgi:hypothetical protein
MDLSSDDKERTPPAKSAAQISASLIDPALHSGSPSDDEATMRTAQAATEVAERSDVQSQWVEKARLIEYLRNYIATRLDRGEFDELEGGLEARSPESRLDDHMEGVETTSALPRSPRSQSSPVKSDVARDTVMYPTLRGLDEDGDSKMPS